MSKSLALEYAKKIYNINCISPGFIKTAMTDKLNDKFREAIISKNSFSTTWGPRGYCKCCTFLCSINQII